MPVNRLKLMAFAFGAAVAALTGTFATALNGSVFPQNFEFPLLITVYTMVILGGAGSQAGVVLGAVIVSVLLEVLRDPGDSRGLFYVLISSPSSPSTGPRSSSPSWSAGRSSSASLPGRRRRNRRQLDDGRGRGERRLGDWAADWVVVPAVSPSGSAR